ncbi:hypothetical protein ACFOLF_31820 [Paenibacillus sepulcri]|uniref:Uncharacterized protein n=1 Tax=Paenibacillus sepulcri TaxID=359917 RepID=A0ABS7C7U8_9BACL|nr:hypothetical protein [Paenibacillus sepulcri]
MGPSKQPDLTRILRKLGTQDIVESLSGRLSGSELNTLLLKVFQEKAEMSSAGDLLKRYGENRFVQPANADAILLKQLELDILKMAARHTVSAVQLSPVAPLGSSSVVAAVDQNKIISALRGTEVVSDATNLLALYISDMIKTQSVNNRDDYIRLCTTHRHVRAQYFGNIPGMLPHFHLFCMVTAGEDKGSYGFEKQSFWEQIMVYRDLFQSLFGSEIEIILSGRAGYPDTEGLLTRVVQFAQEQYVKLNITVSEPKMDNQYYKGFQFTIKTTIQGRELNIGDGGFVDWTQQLLGAKKERLLISAIGLDRLLV